MPHKRNPARCERVCGLARVLRGYAVAALENVALWHERDISNSSVERVILPDACCALDYMLRLFTGVMDGLRVMPERMRRNLDLTQGLLHSQRVLLALTEAGMTRTEAYGIRAAPCDGRLGSSRPASKHCCSETRPFASDYRRRRWPRCSTRAITLPTLIRRFSASGCYREGGRYSRRWHTGRSRVLRAAECRFPLSREKTDECGAHANDDRMGAVNHAPTDH